MGSAQNSGSGRMDRWLSTPTLAYISRLRELTNRTDSTANPAPRRSGADVGSFPNNKQKFGQRAGAAQHVIGGTPPRRAISLMGPDAGAER